LIEFVKLLLGRRLIRFPLAPRGVGVIRLLLVLLDAIAARRQQHKRKQHDTRQSAHEFVLARLLFS
jgi:hypothetical protein